MLATNRRIVMAVAFLFISVLQIIAQNAENQTEKKENFKMSGNADLSFGYYESFGIEARRDRFSYLLSAGLNPQIGGVNVALSATYSQQETTFLQPFNQLGFSPTYKGVTLHGGFRNLNYSSLTLGGHTFLGAGADVKIPVKKGPFDYKVSAMYGRLRRAVTPLEAETNSVDPVYRRMGYGASIGLIHRKNARNYLDLILFRGYDVAESIETPVLSQNVKPQDNLVLGFKGQFMLLQRLTFSADVAQSALTRDIRSEKEADARGLFRSVNGLFTNNISTEYNDAMRLGLNYNAGIFSLGVKYNRIDPNYRSLGTFFFQNDMEEIAFNGAATLLKGRANLSGSLGFQRNNLGDLLNTGQNRTIGSLNWTHAVSDNLTYNAGFSNYTAALVVVQDVLSDSLNLYQLSTNYNAGISYGFGTEKLASRINLQGGHQLGRARDEYFIQNQITKFYNAGLSYILSVVPQNLSFQLSLNYTLNQSVGMEIANLGPSIGVTKGFPDKGLNLRYNFTYLVVGENFNVFNNRVGIDYKIAKKHKVRVGLGLMSRVNTTDADASFSELRALTGYSFSF